MLNFFSLIIVLLHKKSFDYFLFYLFFVDLKNADAIKGKIAIIERGDCTFIDKARKAEAAGALAVVVLDNIPDTSIGNKF